MCCIKFRIDFFNHIMYTGAFCGPLLGGFLYDRIGFLWLCIVIAFVMFLSAPIALIFTGERKITLSKTTSKCTS